MEYKNDTQTAVFKSPSRTNLINSNDIFSVFCNISSIRGMQKINKAQTPFLKILWIGFVFSTTMLLLVTIVLLVKEYLGYYTAWHTSTKLEDDSTFPAITMCSHNPFSMKAKSLWQTKEIKTPYQFTSRLIDLSLNNMNDLKYQGFESMVLRDEVQNYYMNLKVNESINLSHREEFFQFCVVDLQDQKFISNNCTGDLTDKLSVKMFSHRNYFNCWTVEPQKTINGIFFDISSLIIVASLIPSHLIPEYKESFIMDILERGEGLKVVLHEYGTYPDIDKYGFNIQPGKLNEIAYEPIKWTSLSTPVKVCKDDQDEIQDLDRIFNYTFTQCVDTVLQDLLIKKCKCMSSLWPRRVFPNEKYSYCFSIWRKSIKEIKNNLSCLTQFMAEMKSLKKFIQMNQCFPRCNFFSYTTTLSITKWVPSIQKLDRIHQVQYQVELLFEDKADKVRQQNYRNFLQTTYQKTLRSLNNDSLDEDRFTYIKLIRKNKNTTIKTEKLILDVAILLSRIGGLCSLFIGLTLAFFIELIEFIYTLVKLHEQTMSAIKLQEKKIIPVLLNQEWDNPPKSNSACNQNKHAHNDIIEILIDKPCQYFDIETKSDDISDNETYIWHQGKSNNSLHDKRNQRSYSHTIVSEL